MNPTTDQSDEQATSGQGSPDRIDPDGASPGGIGLLEGVLVPAVVGLWTLASIVAVGSTSVLTRPMWLDEIHTALLVGDPSLLHALCALSHGADYNPPLTSS